MSVSSSCFGYCSRCTAQEYKLWELLFGVKEAMTCYQQILSSAGLQEVKDDCLKTGLVATNKTLQNGFDTKTDQK